MTSCCLTFIGSCIVTQIHSKTNQMHNSSSSLNINPHVSDVSPSIIRSSRLYIQHQIYVIQFRWLLASGHKMEQQFHLLPARKQSTNLYDISDAVCTVLDTWWWTERPSERVIFNKLEKLCILLVLLEKYITIHGPMNVKKEGQYTYDVTLSRVRVTTIAVRKQCLLYECVCILVLIIQHANLVLFGKHCTCIVICGLPGFITLFHIISKTARLKKIEPKMCALIFSTTIIWNISHSTKNSAKGKGKVHTCTGTEALHRPYGP
jgi:hypothetical protein